MRTASSTCCRETTHDALRSECWEKLGVEVHVGDPLFVRGYIGANHGFSATEGEDHQVELMFGCRLAGEALPQNGPHPDPRQVGVAWLPLHELTDYRLYPKALRAGRSAFESTDDHRPYYLGNVN